jgi:hypothetical protein
VRRKARNRVAAVALVAFVAGVVLATGQVSGTFALFTAETENAPSTFSGGWVNAPTALTVVPWGYGGSFAWTVGNTGSSPFDTISSQQLEGGDQDSTNNCTSPTYNAIGTALGAAATSATDGESSATNGHYFCYEMQDFKNSWYADAAFSPAPVHVGLIVTSVALANGTHMTNKVDSGDTIKITFNQNVSNVPGSPKVCQRNVGAGTGIIFIGDTGTCNGTSESYTIGKITGVTEGGNGNSNASASVASNVVTVTLSQNGQNSSNVTPVFTPSATTITSTNGSPVAAPCTSSTYNCTPTPSGNF